MSKDVKTPMLDDLEKGAWPSFVKEIKKAAKKSNTAQDLLGILERSYRDKVTHWKHGGIVGVLGYGGGVIGRYCDLPEEYPGVAHFHTVRVNPPAALYYTSQALRELCDIWDKYGSGITNAHGSTGDLIFLGTQTDKLEPIFAELTAKGWDLGGSGSCFRTPSACVGMSRCEYACIDTMNICNEMNHTFQDELHRPAFPYKFKIKVSGCANDCTAAIARADMSIIGTWRDSIQIDQNEVKNYTKTMDIKSEIVDMCPTKCVSFDGSALKINDKDCIRCMHCINQMPKALRPGKEKGATILLGGKAPIVTGALMSWVLIPFVKLEPPYDNLKELVRKLWEWWDEHGKNRERIGELVDRMGMKSMLESVGLPPVPQMVKAPRSNPYVFWAAEDVK
jgi:dissimilatory sulfite reductase alpha subunit